jgi:hypothetical protein
MLKWLRSIDWTAILASTLVMVLLLWFLAANPDYNTYPATYKNPLQYVVGWLSSEGWTALFTCALFISTVGLWVQTRDAADVSVRGLETVERAYIFPDFAGALKQNGDRISVEPLLYNAGKTPAVIDEFFAGYWYSDNLPAEPSYTRAFGTKATGMNTVIPTLASKDVGNFAPTLRQPTFFYGCVWYTDVFHKQRATRFCIRLYLENPAMPKYMVVPDKPEWTSWS